MENKTWTNCPEYGTVRRVVTAACRNPVTGKIFIGIRHYCPLMRQAIEDSGEILGVNADQGFVDQWGNFLTRDEAWYIVSVNEEAHSLRYPLDEYETLYSENLH